MAPKPFNPPRPRTSAEASTSKSRGRPKGSINAPKDKSSATKSKPKPKSKDPKRTSSARFPALPSLSPDTRRELEGSDVEETADSDLEMVDRVPSSQNQENEDEEDDDPFASQPKPKKSRPSNTIIDIDDEEGEETRNEKIPDDLLSVILHQFFKEEGTRMHRDSTSAVARYMEVFVREGIARAVWGRGDEGTGGTLEVEDLEKLAPQLVLDF